MTEQDSSFEKATREMDAVISGFKKSNAEAAATIKDIGLKWTVEKVLSDRTNLGRV